MLPRLLRFPLALLALAPLCPAQAPFDFVNPVGQGYRLRPNYPFETFSALRFNQQRVATAFAGATLDAQVAAAFADCGNSCVVKIPAGAYSYSNSILIPVTSSGNYKLECDEGAQLNYSGSGFAIDANCANPAACVNAANVVVKGCHIYGTANGAGGVRYKVTNHSLLEDCDILNFSNGDGFRAEGANTTTLLNNNLRVNRIGYHGLGAFVASAYWAPSGNQILGGHIQSNTLWGVFEDNSLGNNAEGTTNTFTTVIEGNGSNATSTSSLADNATCSLAGACLQSNVVTITCSTACNVVPGQMVYQSGFGNAIFNTHVLVSSVPNSTSYTYTYIGTSGTHAGGGTIATESGEVMLQSGAYDTFSGVYSEHGPTTDAMIYLGDVNGSPVGVTFSGGSYTPNGATNAFADFCSSGTSLLNIGGGWTGTNFYVGECPTGKLQSFHAILSSANITATSKIVGTPDASSATIIDGRMNAYGVSWQHASTSSTCTTAASAGAQCNFTFTWPQSFGDTNYDAFCMVVGATSGEPTVQGVTTPTATNIGVVVAALTAAAAQPAAVSCYGVHINQ